MTYLEESDLLKVEASHNSEKSTSFTIGPLLPGYGHTLGNALRRVLLSSLKGAAITAVRINDASHEFSVIKGIKEDLIEIILNLKSVRIHYSGDDPITINLNIKGEKKVTAADFNTPAGVEIANPEQEIAHVEKGSSIEIEAIVETGRGYIPTEKQNRDNLAVGMIAIDAIYTPIKKISYQVNNTRVGQATDFDKIILDIETDGSIDPSESLQAASSILIDHFSNIKNQIIPVSKKEAKPITKKRSVKKISSE